MKLKNYKHGKSKTKNYNIWNGIKFRCYNPKSLDFKYYGGRGITMQADWINNFLVFNDYIISLGKYKECNIGRGKLTLDRIDGDKGYIEGNLRWATNSMQSKNRGIYKNNKSGYTGVSYDKKSKKYKAQITINKKQICLGYDKNPSKAYKLRLDYIKMYNLKGFKTE